MPILRCLTTCVLFIAAANILHATQDVTAVTTTTSLGSPSTSDGYTYNNGVQSITTFSTATNTYGVAGTADNVFIRRNNVNSNQSSVWYTNSGVGTDLSGTHYDDYGQMLHSNNIFGGSDNTFANGTVSTTGNIERIDFTWNAPIVVNANTAFAVFDRGAVGVHDSFSIAAVTAIDGAGNPTAFGNVLTVAPGWGGATNAIADFGYRLFRYANGDIITTTTDSTATATQGIGGIMISPTDLGLILGQNIYGYVLMGGDVTATTSAQVLDWTNATYFPTTTDGNTGGGGIDLAAINGFAFAVVPEFAPSAGLLGLFVIFVSVCHQRRKRSAKDQ